MIPADQALLVAQWRDPAYWRSLLPEAPVEGASPQPPASTPPAEADSAAVAADLRRQGYAVVHRGPAGIDVAPARGIVEALLARGLHPVFAFVYDALWTLPRAAAVQRLAGECLGGEPVLVPTFWPFHVPAGGRGAGFGPHRDSVAPDPAMVVRPDGTPHVMTAWIPLTDATLDNGCMYVVPREAERVPPGEFAALYGRQDDPTAVARAVMHRVRALPAAAGSVLCWRHDVLHWGGFSAHDSREPRLSLGYVLAHRNAPRAALVGEGDGSLFIGDAVARMPLAGPLPPFERRLQLIALALATYRLRQTPGGPLHLFALETMRGVSLAA